MWLSKNGSGSGRTKDTTADRRGCQKTGVSTVVGTPCITIQADLECGGPPNLFVTVP